VTSLYPVLYRREDSSWLYGRLITGVDHA